MKCKNAMMVEMIMLVLFIFPQNECNGVINFWTKVPLGFVTKPSCDYDLGVIIWIGVHLYNFF